MFRIRPFQSLFNTRLKHDLFDSMLGLRTPIHPTINEKDEFKPNSYPSIVKTEQNLKKYCIKESPSMIKPKPAHQSKTINKLIKDHKNCEQCQGTGMLECHICMGEIANYEGDTKCLCDCTKGVLICFYDSST